MELRDYLRMLRRGWPTILLLIVLGVSSSIFYLVVTPKQYVATAVLFISPKDPHSVTDLQLGSQYAIDTAASYADIINSATVLGPVTQTLPSSYSVTQLESMVVATPRQTTALIDISVTSDSAVNAANVANATATAAVRIIPSIAEGDRQRPSLVTLQATRKASAPTGPVSPNSEHILVLGFVVGLALGLGLAISRQTLDTRLRRPEDLDRLTPLPLLTVVPKLNRHERAGVVVRDDPASTPVESFRSLRTNLAYLEAESRRSLLFTSVSKTREDAQVPVNLAWSIAQTGRRVLLIDLDLRQSVVGEMMGLPGLLGMTDVLAGDVRLSDAVQGTAQANLHVLVAGRTGHYPSDLLSGTNMQAVLRVAERQYDVVIMHAPPLLRYTDAAVLSRIASHTLVTVSAGHTRALELSAALGVLRNVHVEPLGIVLAGARGFVGEFRRFGMRTRTPADSTRRHKSRVPVELSPAAAAGASSAAVIETDGDRRLRAESAPPAEETPTEPRHRRRGVNIAPLGNGGYRPTQQRFRGVRARTPADFPRRRNNRGPSESTPASDARSASRSVGQDAGEARRRSESVALADRGRSADVSSASHDYRSTPARKGGAE